MITKRLIKELFQFWYSYIIILHRNVTSTGQEVENMTRYNIHILKGTFV